MADIFWSSPESAGEADGGTLSTLIDDSDEQLVPSCGETTIELEIQRPNFYFVLDSSESMLEMMPNSGGISRHLGARRAIGEMLRSAGGRINFGAATFPEQGGCSPGAEVFAVRPGDPWRADAGDGPALDALLSTLRKQRPDGATPVSQTLRELQPRLQGLPGTTSVFLLTDGAPNCDVSKRCDPDRCIPNIERLKLEEGQVCGKSVDCCAPGLAPHLCLDDDNTSEALRELADAGIRTYVIGIPGSETYAEVLSAMAVAADTPRNGDEAYYRVGDAEELALTLSDLGSQLSLDCSFELGEEPKRASRVGVYMDERAIDQDEENGFSWASATALELRGTSCAEWRSGSIQRIRVLEGCSVQMR